MLSTKYILIPPFWQNAIAINYRNILKVSSFTMGTVVCVLVCEGKPNMARAQGSQSSGQSGTVGMMPGCFPVAGNSCGPSA